MRVVTTEEYLQIPRPNLNWLVKEQVPFPGSMLLMGPPKAGKSFLAFDLARCIAKGIPFLGWPTKQSKTLYLQFDTGEQTWRQRLQHMKDLKIDLSGSLYTVHPEDMKLPINILNQSDRTWLREIVSHVEPDFVVLDVFREIHSADENDSTQMKIVGDLITTLFKGISLCLVHHSKKLSDDFLGHPDPAQVARGSSYLTGKVDVLWLLYRNQLYIQNRTSEPQQIKLFQTPSGLWEIAKNVPVKGDASKFF